MTKSKNRKKNLLNKGTLTNQYVNFWCTSLVQMVSNKCTKFKKKLGIYVLEQAWTKWCPQTGVRQRNRQTDMTDRHDRQTDKDETNISPNFVCKGYKNRTRICKFTQSVLYNYKDFFERFQRTCFNSSKGRNFLKKVNQNVKDEHPYKIYLITTNFHEIL